MYWIAMFVRQKYENTNSDFNPTVIEKQVLANRKSDKFRFVKTL